MRICIIVYRTWAVSFVICIADFTKTTFETRIVKRKTQSYKTHVNIFWQQQWHTNRISWWGAIFWYLVTIATCCSPGEDIWHNGTKIAKTTVTWHNGSLCFEQWMIPLFAAKNTFRLQWIYLQNGPGFCKILQHLILVCRDKSKEKPLRPRFTKSVRISCFFMWSTWGVNFPSTVTDLITKRNNILTTHQWSFVLHSLDQSSRTDWELDLQRCDLACPIL